MMIPPSAPLMRTASSVVGVVAKPMFITSAPIPISVPHTTFLTIGPEMRASRPTTIFSFFSGCLRAMKVAYAETNLTMSSGFRVSPARPPIVPRMPEIDLISVILRNMFEGYRPYCSLALLFFLTFTLFPLYLSSKSSLESEVVVARINSLCCINLSLL